MSIHHRNSLVLNLLLLCVVLTACDSAVNKPTVNIPIKVAIIYNLGGAQPVARETFYLLDADPVQLWNNAGLVPQDRGRLWLDIVTDKLFSKIQNRPSKFDDAIKSHVVGKTTTDFQGNATFENVSAGTFHIFGLTETRGGFAIWNFEVTPTANETIFLDNNNAVYAR